MKKIILGTMIVATVNLLGGHPIRAEESAVKSAEQNTKLYEGIKAAKVSLKAGLSASESKGKPISGKFEMDDGKLQLSVYTMSGNEFSEVVVDHATGKIGKVEGITGGDDLAAAKTQSEAMTSAKISLASAVAKALAENQGFRAVSVTPSVKDGHPVADVVIFKGQTAKTVAEKLD